MLFHIYLHHVTKLGLFFPAILQWFVQRLIKIASSTLAAQHSCKWLDDVLDGMYMVSVG
jgi:hypothetical protein